MPRASSVFDHLSVGCLLVSSHCHVFHSFSTLFLLSPRRPHSFLFNHDILSDLILSFLPFYLIFSQGHAITWLYQTTQSIQPEVQDKFIYNSRPHGPPVKLLSTLSHSSTRLVTPASTSHIGAGYSVTSPSLEARSTNSGARRDEFFS